MIYTAWGTADGYGSLFVQGHRPAEWDFEREPGPTLLRTFEAVSPNDAMRQYYEWQG